VSVTGQTIGRRKAVSRAPAKLDSCLPPWPGRHRRKRRHPRPSGAFFNLMQTPAGAFASTLDPTLAASHGGFPLVEGGKIIGAIGCSGATGDQDGVACKAGADTVK
jgi:glc operon protein GlcG